MTPNFLTRVIEELGLLSIHNSPIDTKLLCLQRFVRLFAYGGTTLVLALYLSALGISDVRIGLFMTLTLAGDALISFWLTLVADSLGRRAILALGALLMIVSGIVFAFSSNYWVLLAAAILGVISPRYAVLIQPFLLIADRSRTVAMRLGPSEQLKNRPLPTSLQQRIEATCMRGTLSLEPLELLLA